MTTATAETPPRVMASENDLRNSQTNTIKGIRNPASINSVASSTELNYPTVTNIISQINWYFQLKDSEQLSKFEAYYQKQHVPYTLQLLFIVLFVLFFIAIYKITVLVHEIKKHGATTHLMTMMGFQAAITAMLFLISLIGGVVVWVTSEKTAWFRILVELFCRKASSIFRVEDGSDTSSSRKQSISTNGSLSGGRTHRIAPFSGESEISGPTLVAEEDPMITITPESSLKIAFIRLSQHWSMSLLMLKSYFLFTFQLLLILCIFRNITHRPMNKPNQIFADEWLFDSPTLPREHSNFYIVVSSFFLYSTPYSFFTLLPDLHIALIWILYVISSIVVAFVVSYLHSYQAIVVVVLTALCFICMTLDLQIHKIHTFLLNSGILEKMERQEKMAILANAQEMRHMIANVAHDLKTVSYFYICLRI